MKKTNCTSKIKQNNGITSNFNIEKSNRTKLY